MYLGWLRHGAVELVNDARVEAYARYHCLTGVQIEDAGWLESYLGTSYAGPVGPAAPWFSAAEPASTGFLGLMGVSAVGLEASPRSRTVTAAAVEGGTPGTPIAAPKEIVVTAVLVATSTAGFNYGLTWLSSVLEQRDTAGYDATGEQAHLSAVALPPRWGQPRRPGSMAAPLRLLAVDPADGATPADERVLYDVVLTDGPDVSALHSLPATPSAPAPIAAEVTFTLTAASPWLWRPPQQLSYTTLAAWPHAYGTGGNPWVSATNLPVKWVMARDLPAPLTPRGEDPLNAACAAGGGCPTPVTLPRPAPDIDWCAATMPFVPRWGGLGDLKDAGLATGLEYAPLVVIEPGAAPMRRASVRIGRRLPGGFHDPSGLLLRTELNVPYLPAGCRCVLDGRSGTALVDCAPTGSAAGALDPAVPPEKQYTPAVYGIRASPVTWPLLVGGEDLRVTAHAEDNFCAAGAKFTLFAAGRQALA